MEQPILWIAMLAIFPGIILHLRDGKHPSSGLVTPHFEAQSVVVFSYLKSVLAKTLGRSVRQSYFKRCSLIHSLHDSCSPSAVSRFVVAVVVDAIQRHTARAFAHVRKERCKVSAPPFTHRDATPAVSRIGRIPTVKASGFHVSPDAELTSRS